MMRRLANIEGPSTARKHPFSTALAVSQRVFIGPYAWLRLTNISVAICILLILAFVTRNFFVDDAFIGFQFLRNVLQGHGFVFYPGHAPVEGVTNIGWLALLAPFGFVADIPTVAKAAGLIALLLAAVITYRLMSRILHGSAQQTAMSIISCSVPMLVLAVNYDFSYFSLAGMETGLLALIFLLMALWSINHPVSSLLAVAGWYAYLVHPEAGLVYPIYLVLAFLFGKFDRRKLAIALAVFVLLVLAVTLFRIVYFGTPLPNTFTAKTVTPASVIYNLFMTWFGKNVNVPFPVSSIFIFPFVFVGFARLLQISKAVAFMLVSTVVMGFVFSIYAFQDWTQTGRYIAPYLPVIFILLWLGVHEIFSRLASSVPSKHDLDVLRDVAPLILAAMLIVLSLFNTVVRMSPNSINTYPGYVLTSNNLARPALWIRQNLPAGSVIATRRIGVLAYYSGMQVFDYSFGLTEPDVAQAIAQRRNTFDDPNDADLATIWAEHHPDYILEDNTYLEPVAQKVGGTVDDFTVQGIRYKLLNKFDIGEGAKWILVTRQ